MHHANFVVDITHHYRHHLSVRHITCISHQHFVLVDATNTLCVPEAPGATHHFSLNSKNRESPTLVQGYLSLNAAYNSLTVHQRRRF